MQKNQITLFLIALFSFFLITPFALADISTQNDNALFAITFDTANIDGRTLVDSAGNLNYTNRSDNPSNTGGTTVAGMVGQGMLFEATEDDYINASTTLSGEPVNTFTIWIKPTGGTITTATTINMHFAADDTQSQSNGRETITLGNFGGSCLNSLITVFDDAGQLACLKAGELANNTWHHIAMTYNESGSGNWTFYLNGTRQSYGDTAQGAGQIFLNDPSFARFTSALGGSSFTGVADELITYNTSLTDSEVAQMFGNQTLGQSYPFTPPPPANNPPTSTTPTNTTVVDQNTDTTWSTTLDDDDGDFINVTFYHSVNGTLAFTETLTNQQNTTVTSTLNKANYTNSSTVSVIVETFDGTDYGTNTTNSFVVKYTPAPPTTENTAGSTLTSAGNGFILGTVVMAMLFMFLLVSQSISRRFGFELGLPQTGQLLTGFLVFMGVTIVLFVVLIFMGLALGVL